MNALVRPLDFQHDVKLSLQYFWKVGSFFEFAFKSQNLPPNRIVKLK